MGKVRDASKERYWRKLIRRQRATGEPVARFCARKGLAAHQFYWWQRTLRVRDRQSADASSAGEASGGLARNGEPVANSFVSVRLPFLTAAPLEVVHPGGCVVRVPVGFDPLSLRRVLTTLEPSPSDRAEH